MSQLNNVMISFVCGIAGALTFNVLHMRLYDRPIATVSVDQLISEHLESVARDSNLAETDIETLANDYADVIQDTIRAISEDQQVTLLVKPAVLTEAPDYTDAIRQALAQVHARDE